jgi:hypothetical protein
MPLLLGQLYFLMRKRYWLAALTIFLSGVIYPIAFVIGVMTYGLLLIKSDRTRRLPFTLDWPHLWPLLMAVTLVAICLLPFASVLTPTAGVTNTTEAAKMTLWNNPDLQSGGRRQLFGEFPLVGRGGLADDGLLFLILFILIIFALIIWRIEPASLARTPAALKFMLLAGFLGYGLAWVAALLASSFIAHMPSRYTQVSLFLFLFFYVGTNAGQAAERGAAKLRNLGLSVILIALPAVFLLLLLIFKVPAHNLRILGGVTLGRFVLIGLLLLVLLLSGLMLRRRHEHVKNNPAVSINARKAKWAVFAVGFVVWALWYGLVLSATFYSVGPNGRELFTFIKTLPKDSLLAGSPCTLDSVPFFAERMVLSSCENPNPDPKVIRDSLDAFYAEDLLAISTFCRQYGVDYLVVDTGFFAPEAIQSGEYFFEPYTSELAPRLSAQTRFALNEVSDDEKLFRSGPLYVMACPVSGQEATFSGARLLSAYSRAPGL